MIVVDASVVVDFLVDAGERGGWASRRILAAESLHAPHLLDLEVLSTIRRWTQAGTLTSRRAGMAVDDLAAFALSRYPTTPLLDRIWQLRPHLTAYDACYIALAEALDAPLVTADLRLTRSHGHRASIETPP